MIEANRAVARLGYERIGLTEAVVEATTGWYGLLFFLVTPATEFLPDPSFEREVGYLYARAERGESLGGDLTPASR